MILLEIITDIRSCRRSTDIAISDGLRGVVHPAESHYDLQLERLGFI